MLTTKMIVVAQRDEYEDHYRSMVSLVCGAMVMTDVMLGLPDGFQDKQNIVVYSSAETLKEQLYFYLNTKNEMKRRNIAKKGWEMAMPKHRSWQRVEELLFGNPVSKSRKLHFRAPEKGKRTILQKKNQIDMDDSVLSNIRTMVANKQEDD
jgi:Glycosyl transferases group 1